MTEEGDVDRVFEYARNHLLQSFESPRRLLKSVRRPPQSFKIIDVRDDSVLIEFSSKGTRLRLERWRFIEAISLLKENGKIIRVGASLDSKDTISLEGHLQACQRER